MARGLAQNKTAIDDRKRSYKRACQQALIHLLLDHKTATTDEVQKRVERHEDVHPSAIGSAVAELSREGLIRYDTAELTTRPEGRGRLLRIWQLTDAPLAQEWLAQSSGTAQIAPQEASEVTQ